MIRIAFTISLILFCVRGYPHGGGLDGNGGHHNRQTGGYHCHREPCFTIHKQTDKATQEAERSSYSVLYDRDDWGSWIDADNDCQDTRAEILIRDSQQPVGFKSDRQCKVASGLWKLPYSGSVVTDPSQIDIDHVIPLRWAHGHGGDRWTLNQKRIFANDPENLLATYYSANRSKGA
jgi:hypothetical protein